MPGRLDAMPGSLGKRKRIEGLSDSSGLDSAFKNKVATVVRSDHMAIDSAFPDLHHGLNHFTVHPSSRDVEDDQQQPPRFRRKLALPRNIRPSIPSVFSHSIYPTASKSTVQTPCHRCHKAPLQKKDLESFTDCARCQQRTCLVCLRQCGCQKKICADCSVEEGIDGDVYCLDCFGKIQDVGTYPQHNNTSTEDREMDD